MKKGDLVELSAQGKNLLWLNPLRGMYGLVMSEHGTRLKVQWFGKNKTGRDVSRWHTIDRRSLKHAKCDRFSAL